jgi:hypothetical protein
VCYHLTAQLLDHLRAAITATGLWDELAAIPVTPAEATAIHNWRGETLDTMRRLRQAKNLINAAENLPAHRTRNSPPTSTCGSDSNPGWPDDR